MTIISRFADIACFGGGVTGMADIILDLTVSRDRAPERPNGHECARQDAELREQTTA